MDGMLATAYANTAHIGAMYWAWIIPVLGTVGLLAWLWVTVSASSRKIHPERRNDQTNHRGMEQGGLYYYRPGMFSHSYPPTSEQDEEFQYENPQPGREPRVQTGKGLANKTLRERAKIVKDAETLKNEVESLKRPKHKA
ncbi:hypothetical protein [Actinomadura opuntiae]|uniref:hypothetical protein n=1 Tax=Actinomadura sp. OS1-43 TaxID=604315 RepID=UPI00255AB630|nr:hypothetical protein [Actinomadura sp. OS1-43]MDL4820846.1 hypothetical protein [Actinomadura sp. OS1-43]